MKRKIIGLLLIFLAMSGIAATMMVGETTTIHVKDSTLQDHACDSTEWHFVINQIQEESLAPQSITVSWANGATETVPLEKFTGGTAHYTTYSNLDSQVTDAWTEIYPEWVDGGGQFNLSHGPCYQEPTPTPTNTQEPTSTPTETQQPTATKTPTPTETQEPTSTGTVTEQPTSTPTEEPTATKTPESTPTEVEPPPGGTVPAKPLNKIVFITGFSAIGMVGLVLFFSGKKQKVN